MAETAMERREATGERREEEERRAEITERKRIENARSWGNAWVEQNKLEFIAFARQLGLGDAGRTPVSSFLRNKMAEKADPTRTVLAIEQYRASIEGPEGISAVIGFREIRSARMIWAHANAARDGHKMASLVGFTGAGKTEAVRQYQRQTHGDRKPPVRIVTCNIYTNHVHLARQLALDMGLVERGGEPATLAELIVRRLRSHPEFLVVDEANWLSEKCLHALRYFHDVTGTGLLMIGTPYFLSMVANRAIGAGPYAAAPSSPAGRRPYDGPLALFADRIFTRVIPGVMDEEVGEIAEDVLRAQLSDEGFSKLLFYVNHNMRLLTRILLQLREYRKTGQKKIDEKMVEAAWAKLQHIEVA